MFQELDRITRRPEPFSRYSAADLWTDDHISAQMLKYHLDGSVDISSRRTDKIERACNWMIARFELGSGKTVADFGCGPGLYTTRLARSGAEVTGVDFSSRSLDYARQTATQEGLTVNYVQANYLDFETDVRFDLITMIMCDFCVLSPDQRRIMLDKFHTLLKPGGAVLLDAYTLSAFSRREESSLFAHNLMGGFWAAEPYFGFQNTFVYDDEKVVLDKFTIVEATRSREILNWLQYFEPEQLRHEFADHRLPVEVMLGDVAGSDFDSMADEFALIARKTK